MRIIRRSTVSPIGLDLGSYSFKAVQLARTGTSWEIARSVSLDRVAPDGPITRDELVRFGGVLDRRGFKGNRVVTSVPSEKLLTAMLELPARGAGVPLDQIAAIEFGRVHKKDPASLTLSTWELPAPARAAKATYMLGMGAGADDLNAVVDLIESAEFQVVALDEPHSAAARGCIHLTDIAGGLVGIIDLGWKSVTLTILKAHTIVYTRRLNDSGMAELCGQATDYADIEMDAAHQHIWAIGFNPSTASQPGTADMSDVLHSAIASLLREVSQAFSYARHRYADSDISQAILIGGGASIPGIADRFSATLGVSTLTARNHSSSAQTLDPSLVTALGLSLFPGVPR